MSDHRFVQGERIVCINSEGYPKTLEVGREYRVMLLSLQTDHVIIEACGRVTGFEAHRFQKKEKANANIATSKFPT